MLADFITEVIEALQATKSYNKKLADLIYEGLNKMQEDGMNKIMYDTQEYDLTIRKDRDTGIEGMSNIHILISPR